MCIDDPPKPQPVEKMEAIELVQRDEGKKAFIRTQLNEQTRREIAECLQRNSDVFAWTPTDMPGINPEVICHKLNVSPGHKPIKQKKRNFSSERQKAITEEVNKLLEADFIREVYYP